MKKFDWSDQKGYRVVEHTYWPTIKRFEENLEPRAGVYIFADRDHRVKYVGSAKAGRMVEEVKHARWRGKDKGATLVKGLYTNRTKWARELEKKLIHKYQPLHNEDHC
jgi:excinuclease UvrABC nuclease subunit